MLFNLLNAGNDALNVYPDTGCPTTLWTRNKTRKDSNVAVTAATDSLGGAEPMTDCVKPLLFDGPHLKFTKASPSVQIVSKSARVLFGESLCCFLWRGKLLVIYLKNLWGVQIYSNSSHR